MVKVDKELNERYVDTHTYKIHAMMEAREIKKYQSEAVIYVYDSNDDFQKVE